MSLKFLFGLACLISIGKCDNDGESSSNKQTSDGHKWWEPKNNDDYVKVLEHVGESVKSILKKADDLHVGSDIKKWTAAYNEAVDAVSIMSVAAGNLIEQVFPGLGKKFRDMSIAHMRIYACLFISKKLRDWHGGKIKPDLCNKVDYGSNWGLPSYKGSYSSAAEIMEASGLININQQVEELVSKHTNGKGVAALDENVRAIIESIHKIASVMDKFPSLQEMNEKLCVEALGEGLVVLSGIANNVKSGYGVQLLDETLKLYNVSFLEAGYPDISSIIPSDKERISSCGHFIWELKVTPI